MNGIQGNLTKDPVLKYTPNGKAVCNFTVAFSPWDPETRDKAPTRFIKVTAWGQLAENVAETFGQGEAVLVVGSDFGTDEWTKKDGTVVTDETMTAEDVGASHKWSAR